MSAIDLKIGDTVVLQSGGAPLTVTKVNSGGWGSSKSVNLAAMSPGGLLQTLDEVPYIALKKYAGQMTNNQPKTKRGYQ